MENVAPTGGTTMPAQIAMNGQSLPQSGFCWVSGQQGILSGMCSAEESTSAAISIDDAIALAGVACGASTSPSHASAAKRCRMENWRFTAAESHIGDRLNRAGRSQERQHF